MSGQAKTFLVVRCGRHGFAVAMPSKEPGEDLDMILWGVTKEYAIQFAADLEEDGRKEHQRID